MVFIVGLAGPGKVGKSTTAKRLVASFNTLYPNLKVSNYAFAAPIYEISSLLTGLPIEKLKDESLKELTWNKKTAPMPCLEGWTPRKFLQIIGTECFRNNVDKNFWIETALQKIKSFDIAFIEDARFTNEFERCNTVIELERDGVEYAMNHPSAMPPPRHFIQKKIKLFADMDYSSIVHEIHGLYEQSKADTIVIRKKG